MINLSCYLPQQFNKQKFIIIRKSATSGFGNIIYLSLNLALKEFKNVK